MTHGNKLNNDQTTVTLKKDENCIKEKRNLKTTYSNKPHTPIPISIHRKQYINLNGKKWKNYRTPLTSVVTTWYHSKYHWILIFSQNQSLFVSSYPVGMYPEECKVKYHSCSVCLTHLVDHTYTSSSTSFISPGGSLSFLSLFHTHTHTLYTHTPSFSLRVSMPVSFLTCWSNLSGNCGKWVKLCGNEHQEKVKHNKRTTLHNKAGQHSPLNIRFQKGGGGRAYSSQWAMRTIRPSLYVVKQNRIGSKVGRRKKQR